MEAIYKTNIILITEIPMPRNRTHFRLISLCNVIHKTVSKVIANRLQTIMDICIVKA